MYMQYMHYALIMCPHIYMIYFHIILYTPKLLCSVSSKHNSVLYPHGKICNRTNGNETKLKKERNVLIRMYYIKV